MTTSLVMGVGPEEVYITEHIIRTRIVTDEVSALFLLRLVQIVNNKIVWHLYARRRGRQGRTAQGQNSREREIN